MTRRLLVGLLGVVLATTAGCFQHPAPEPVLLGMLQPLSGPGRPRGEQGRHAAALAIADFAARETRVGDRPLAVLHIDSGDGPATVQAQTVRALKINRVPAVIGLLSPSEAEVFFREARLLEAAAILAGETATPPAADGLLALGAGPVARGRALAKFTRENLKPMRVGVLIDDNDPLAVNLATAFVRELRTDPAVPIDQVHGTTPEERAKAARTLAERKPAVVLLATGSAEQAALRGVLAEAGLDVPTLDGGPDNEVAPTAGPPHYRATVYAEDKLTPAGQEFVRQFEKRTGERPGVGAVLAWEAVRFLGEALSKAGSASPLKVRELTTKPETFEGITGPVEFKERQAKRRLFVVRTGAGTSEVEREFSGGD